MAFLLPAQASLSILCRLTPRFLFILTCCSRSSSSVETVENLFFLRYYVYLLPFLLLKTLLKTC
jgi:hypothetical protein